YSLGRTLQDVLSQHDVENPVSQNVSMKIDDLTNRMVGASAQRPASMAEVGNMLQGILDADKAQTTGGIDLTAGQMNLHMNNSGQAIKFHLDPAQLARLGNAPGFMPVIIHVQPMVDLRKFLGVTGS
ncbi:MAG: hypothetical protein KGJ11_05075, partial [Candidatus Omnitrophica bacterium]|nr:hypothetical protein [Candidatus Omnitrophota bacterium]